MMQFVKAFMRLFLLLASLNVFAFLLHSEAPALADRQDTSERLQEHLFTLTQKIGERSVRVAENLERTAVYIRTFYENIQIPVHYEPYRYNHLTVNNVVATLNPSPNPSEHYIIGAHYDSVAGTVGADDNASAIAVQLETARLLSLINRVENMGVMVSFVAFALEEPPVYGTRYMGSRIYAKNAKKRNLRIDGMICLEMVGYSCRTPGCQHYPFPLMFFGYPSEGSFIGIVGNFRSRSFTNNLSKAFKKNQELPVVSLTVPFNGWVMPNVRLSDHASFWDQGYKAVMLTDSAFYRNPHYHQVSDTMDTLDISFMAELVESLAGFFSSLRDVPDKDQDRPHRCQRPMYSGRSDTELCGRKSGGR
jgi:hypothetical protein